MNGDLHHIDDLFKSGLEGKEENPTPAVWEHIEKELDKKDSRPKFFLWWNSRKIAAALLIILGSAGLFAGGYYLRGVKMHNKESNLKPAENRSRSSISTVPAAPGTISGQEGHNRPNTADIAASKPDEATDIVASKPGEATGIDEQQDHLTKAADQSVSEKTTLKPGSTRDKIKDPEVKKEDTGKGSDITTVSGNSSRSKSTGTGSKTEGPVSSTPLKTNTSVADSKKNSPATDMSVDNLPPGNIETAKSWSAADITNIAASRELPGAEKRIPVSQQSGLSGNKNAVSSPSAIPVLNKRTASVDLPRFALTPVMSWQFGSNRIVANNSYPDAGKVKSEIDRTESQPSRIGGGLLADLRIAKNITVQSGLIFTSRQIQIEPKYIKAEKNPDGKVRYKFDCSAGTYYLKKSTYARPGDTALTKYSTNDLNYINIPLSFSYHFGGKKFHLFATAGAGLNILTDQYLETGLHNYNYDEEQSIATNLKSNYFNGTIGAGIDWRAFKKISFIFSPQYQFGLTPMNENMPVKAYPRTFNLQMGMQIRL